MASGGARPGSGRPKKTDKHAGAIARAEKRIADFLPMLVDNMFVLANGVLVEEANPLTGELQVYRKPPDRKANEYLINRIMGLPKARIEQDTTVRNVDMQKLTDEQIDRLAAGEDLLSVLGSR